MRVGIAPPAAVLGADHLELELGRTVRAPDVTQLRYRVRRRSKESPFMPLTTIQALENGPYKVQGPIRAIDMDGGDYAVDVGGVYLCRCGESQTKPFCDGRHARIGFQAPERASGHPPRDDAFATHNGCDRLKPSSPTKGLVKDAGDVVEFAPLLRRKSKRRGYGSRAAKNGEEQMSSSVLDMSMSLDGYIADPNDVLGGEDGERLHKWADADGESGQRSGPTGQFQDEWNAAGAVLAGRRTAELMDHWGGDHGGLPIFVPSHRPPGPAARGAIRW